MRILLQALLILVPFVAYGLYLALVKKGEERGWNTAPYFWLTVCGLVLFGLSFVVLGLREDSHAGRYLPPRIEGGKLLPAETR